MNKFKTLREYVKSATFIMIAVIVLLIISPILIVAAVIGIANDRRKEKEFRIAYNEFLRSADGAKFICYTNKKKTYRFIKEQLIPRFAVSVNEIFLEEKTLHTTYDHNFISRLLINAGSRGGFPILIKISDGQVTSRSINTELYDAMNTHKDVERLLTCIEDFFGDDPNYTLKTHSSDIG